jgi:DNA helicase II / ATP-dependent DNA helicase PcrA
MPDINEVLEQNLSPHQRDAATDQSAEVLCLACAGSGKSRTLAFRIARLIAQGEPASSIVAFTFTEKAADSIKRQVAAALNASGLNPTILGAMYIGTIHSYCQFVLGEMDARYRQYDVLDENRLKLYLISRYYQLGLHSLRAARGASYFDTIREVSDAYKIMNDEMIAVEDVSAHDATLGHVLSNLQARLAQDQFIDFSLMIRLVVEALSQQDAGALRAVSNLQHLMVDEYQDVNPSQETLIRELHNLSSTLFVVGDDDQSIYAWRGADVNNILSFENRYPGCAIHALSHNYRSTPAIVTAADALAAAELGATRITKNPTASLPEGTRDFRNLWFNTRADEAEFVASRIEALLGTAFHERNGTVRGLTPGDFAILMRSTRSAEQDGHPRHFPFTQVLTTREIPYTLEAGGGVFDRPQVRVLRDAFELLRNGSPDRNTARTFFDASVLPAFPNADFNRLTATLAQWGTLIHGPVGGPRRRVYPQQLVHDLLSAFGLDRTHFDAGILHDLGVFSYIIQDVEAVYLSVDSAQRFGELLNFLRHVAETGYDSATEDITRRPDAVTVSTVHRMKGLEFPVVFVVDVEANRFPGTRHNYNGWLPTAVIQPALTRGAYQSTRGEEARLFYTAATRAERYLYISGSANLPGGARPRRPSPFAQRLAHPELSTDANGLPADLTPHTPIPRVDETVVPTSYSEIRYYLRCPRDYQFRKTFGFTPPIKEMFGFGKTVHTAIGKLHEIFREHAPTPDEAEEVARDVFHLKHIPPSNDPVNRPGGYERARDSAGSIARTYSAAYSEDFTRTRQVEARFEIPVSQAVIAGAIDLILSVDENDNIIDAAVIDFKTIEGGVNPEESEELEWTELALQVQLYAKAATEVLGENAQTGAVHLLKDSQRVEVPVTEEAVQAAVANVEWAVDRIIARDFPMRPHSEKCEECDFKALCPRIPQPFGTDMLPPPIHVPGSVGSQMALAFSKFES